MFRGSNKAPNYFIMIAAKHVKFPSIEQYRNVVKHVRDVSTRCNVSIPKIDFLGTVKLHGTNAGVSRFVGNDTMIWAQSRSNVITPESDNAGFARFVEDEKISFHTLFDCVKEFYPPNSPMGNEDVITIFGEWCGQGIQKGVGISELPKMFVIFAIMWKYSYNTPDGVEDENMYYFSPEEVKQVYHNMLITGDMRINSTTIKCIYNYKTWIMTLDLTNPEVHQNELAAITLEVEEKCPVAAAHGIDGVGEGVVWRAVKQHAVGGLAYDLRPLLFKVKGEKHSVTKVKTLAAVDIEKVNSINEFVSNVLTEARLNQGLQYLRETQLDPSISQNIGPFLKWIGGDVIKEESDTMEASGLDRKTVMGAINREARNWYLEQLL
jgi:hypothetical protein